MTRIRTAKTSYEVTDVETPHAGPHALVVRQASGKRRILTIADVGRPRFHAAMSHFLAERRAQQAGA